MKTISLYAPAKVNLYLDVLSKRSDGYHNIETIFEKIDLCDELVLKKIKSGIKISCDNPKVPINQTNICYKAARMVLDEASINDGVAITIRKKIPIGAGLAGGSSNGACVIAGLNCLFGLGLKTKRLLSIGSRLGADVNFFLSGASFAKGWGIGDKLIPLSGPNMHHLLVYPGFGISTKEAYENINLSLTGRRRDIRMLTSSLKKGGIALIGGSIYNRLESVILPKLKALGRIKDILNNAGAKGALMSGSGSVIFGIFEDKRSAYKARDLFKDKLYSTYLVSTFRD